MVLSIQKVNSPIISIPQAIKDEELAEKKEMANKLNTYFKNRSDVRKSISNGQITSGNEAQDVFETRTGKIIDLYLDKASKLTDNNGNQKFTNEQIIEASKTPSKVLEKMKAYYQYHTPDKAWAIDDYIQKGGMATNVFEYLEDVSGNVKNPYGANPEVMGDFFDEDYRKTKEKAPGWAKGVMNYVFEPVSSVANTLTKPVMKLAGEMYSWDWLIDKASDASYKPRAKATEEEYQKYKNGEITSNNDAYRKNMDGHSRAELYDKYTDAQNNGFVGTLDEYKEFNKTVNKATSKVVADRLKQGMLTENDVESSKPAIVADALTEFIEYMAIPLPKIKGNISNGTQGFVNKFAEVVFDALMNTAEFELLEDLNHKGISKGEANTAFGINTLISGITRSPVIAKYLNDINKSKAGKTVSDWFAKVPERVKDAYRRLSVEQLKAIKDMTKKNATQSSIKSANEGVKYFGQQGVDAVQKSLDDYLSAGAKLGKEGQNLKNSGITKELFENKMNESLAKLEDTEFMGNTKRGKGQSPKIHIVETSAGPELKIENRENLNMIKNGERKGLADAIEDIFYGMFGKGGNKAGAGMELNEATLLAFANEVKGATQGTEWSWGNMGARAFGDGLDAFRNSAELPVSFLNAEKDYFNKKDLHKRISDSFGDYGKYSSEVDKAAKLFASGKKLQDPNLQGVLEMAQDAGYISDTLDAEIVAYGYMLALQDEAAARAFFGNIYPSQPGFIEAILDSIRNGIREGTIDRYIASKEVQDTLGKVPGNLIDRALDLSKGDREINKAVGGGANIIYQRMKDYINNKENDKKNRYTFTDDEYNEYIKRVMK